MNNLELAYKNARKGKTWQKAIKDFDGEAEQRLRRIQGILKNKTFCTAAYRTKTIHEPKKREIFILPFDPDRVVQHALMNVVEPIWEGLFINDSYACRKNKGIHAGSIRTMEYVRRNKYCLKCDISKFYPSMVHDVVYDIVKRKIKCKDTLWLLHDIIYSSGGGVNIPIGNYTSQWIGNLYLNELDQYLKHKWHIKDYIRYCDDFILFHDDKSYLSNMKNTIRSFVADSLKLKLSICEVFPVSHGVDFLGYRHFKKYVLLRKSTAKRIMKRYKKLPLLLAKGKITFDQFRSSIASMAGWMRWANTHNLEKRLRLDELKGAIFAA